MNNRFNDMCDVPWWESLKTEDEKNEYCQSHYGMSFAEWEESLNYKYRYDSETQKWVEYK